MAAERKPRIRKTAPTARERIETTKAKAEEVPKRQVIRPGLSKVSKPLRSLRLPKLPDNKLTKPFKKIARIFVPRYFINAWREVRQVVWPTRRETWRLTLAVFIFASVFGALVAGVDKVLDILFKNLVLK